MKTVLFIALALACIIEAGILIARAFDDRELAAAGVVPAAPPRPAPVGVRIAEPTEAWPAWDESATAVEAVPCTEITANGGGPAWPPPAEGKATIRGPDTPAVAMARTRRGRRDSAEHGRHPVPLAAGSGAARVTGLTRLTRS